MSIPKDPDVRHWRGMVGGLGLARRKTQAEHDATMAHARNAQYEADVRQVDPDGILAATDPAELARQVDLLRRMRLAQMSLKAAKARAARRQQAEADTMAGAA